MLFLLKKIFKTERVAIDVMLIYIYKSLYHRSLFNLSKPEKNKILFIVGCQRSGTSLMNRIFARDLNASVYRESSQLSSRDKERLRLNPLPEVKDILSKNKAPLIVIKPLVESQNILDWLGSFSSSKALWMYRNYKDVAKSNRKRFDENQSILDLKTIIQKTPGNWRAEKVSDAVHATISKYFYDDMSVYDAAALFWYARNQLYYELNLENNAQVFICKYEDLVLNPVTTMRDIYQFLNIDSRQINKIDEVHSNSIGKGNAIELSQSVEKLCRELQEKLDRSYRSQHKSISRSAKSATEILSANEY